MSLGTIEKKIEALRAQADQMRTNFDRYRREVNASPNLTPEGRAATLDPMRNDLNEAMRSLSAQEKALVASGIQDLQRMVFGTAGTSPDAVISFRDAQERAARLDGTEAQDAMRRALLGQDDGLAQAILRRAIEEGWRNVVAMYIEEKPTSEPYIKDLTKLLGFKNNATQQFGSTLQYWIPNWTR